jgi:hypothetical protein
MTHFVGASIDSKARGGRFHHLIIDDPEYDPSNSTDRRALTQAFTRKLTRVYLPMLKAHCRVSVIGTLSDRDLFMYHIATTKEDRRFMEPLWHRTVMGVYGADGKNVWPEVYTEEYLRRQRLLLGEAGFNAEFMNAPGVTSGTLLEIHPYLEYGWVDDVTAEESAERWKKPFSCAAMVKWTETVRLGVASSEYQRQVCSAPFNETIEGLWRFITVDYANSQSPEADYCAVVVMGSDRRGGIWVLDAWYGRVKESKLMAVIWKLATRWRVKAICPEAISLQAGLPERMRADFDQKAAVDGLVEGVRPRIIPVKYPGNPEKEDRIAGLEWRFADGLIHFPTMRKFDAGMRELWYQVTNFSTETRALKHDDLVDALAMLQFIVRGKGRPGRSNVSEGTWDDRIAAGEFFIPGTRIPATCGMDVGTLSAAAYNKLMERRADELERQRLLEQERAAHVQTLAWLGSDLLP